MARKKVLDDVLIEETKEDILGRTDAQEPLQQSTTGAAASEIESTSEGMINMHGFSKIDIRVGRILDVEDVPTARKPMYKLRVDLGEVGIRSIVAGIGGNYTKDELIDKRIAVVTNLEPKSIAGEMSHGMLLAAEDGDIISILSPDRNVRAGSAVR
jgi:methionine--tRNA ligase beta chain